MLARVTMIDRERKCVTLQVNFCNLPAGIPEILESGMWLEITKLTVSPAGALQRPVKTE